MKPSRSAAVLAWNIFTISSVTSRVAWLTSSGGLAPPVTWGAAEAADARAVPPTVARVTAAAPVSAALRDSIDGAAEAVDVAGISLLSFFIRDHSFERLKRSWADQNTDGR